MLKLSFCLVRLPSLSREEFQRYWRETHAPLVAKHARALRIRRYLQCHTETTPASDGLRASRGGPDAYDGIAELWWDSLEDLVAATATPEGALAGRDLLEDERRFIDLARSPLFFGREHVIVGSRAP